MEITQTTRGDIVVLQPIGRLDATTSDLMSATLTKLIVQGQSRLILDMSRLEHISSAGLRSLLIGAKQSQARGGRMMLCSMEDYIREVFEIAGFLSIFPTFNSADEAAAAF